MRTQIPLWPYLACHFRDIFSKDASVDTELFPGTFEVLLDHEDLQVHLWHWYICLFIRAYNWKGHSKARWRAVLWSALCVLYFQHPKAEFAKEPYSNLTRTLQQDQLLRRLEVTLVLCKGWHVQDFWLHRASLPRLLTYRASDCYLHNFE
jgi:hypothetical protein